MKVIWCDPNVNEKENKIYQELFKVEKLPYKYPKSGKETVLEGACLNQIFGVDDSQASGHVVYTTEDGEALSALDSCSQCIIILPTTLRDFITAFHFNPKIRKIHIFCKEEHFEENKDWVSEENFDKVEVNKAFKKVTEALKRDAQAMVDEAKQVEP